MEFTEQERHRIDKLQTIPADEWTSEDIELITNFKAYNIAIQEKYEQELNEQIRFNNELIEISNEATINAKNVLDALQENAIQRLAQYD